MPRYLWSPKSKKKHDNRELRGLLIGTRVYEPGSVVELSEQTAAPHLAAGDMSLEGEEPYRARPRARVEAPAPAPVLDEGEQAAKDLGIESEPDDPANATPAEPASQSRRARAVPKPSTPHLSDELGDDEARAVARHLGQPARFQTPAKARDFLRGVEHNRLTAAIAELRAAG